MAFKVHGGKKKSSTAALARNHVIEVSNSGLVSLMGGKWTAYRIQGEQTVDRILKHWPNEFKHRKYETGQTLNFNLIGSYGRIDVIEGISWGNEALYKQYEDHFVFKFNVERDIAKHLIKEYGTRALAIVELASSAGLNKRLHPDYPFYEGEVLYAMRSEMAQKPNDIVCRRAPISFLDSATTKDVVLPRVVDIMAKELKWSNDRKTKELAEAQKNISSMK